MKKKKYWETKEFKKKQNNMIRLLMKELRKYGYSVRVAN
jgi:N-acetyl-anhydromuramyl-L-alanine amidase AmpD